MKINTKAYIQNKYYKRTEVLKKKPKGACTKYFL